MNIGDRVRVTAEFHYQFPSVRRGLTGRVIAVERDRDMGTQVRVHRDGMVRDEWWASAYWRRLTPQCRDRLYWRQPDQCRER